MSETDRPSIPANQSTSTDGDFSSLDVLIVVAKHKISIIAVVLGATGLSVAVALFLPNTYTATTKILPPQHNQSTASVVLGQIGGLASLGGSALSLKNPNDLYVGMLKSRTVADRIIARFDLMHVYDLETMVETRRKLARNTAIGSGKDGLIYVEFVSEDASQAAAIANAYIEELDGLTQNLAVTEAAQRRLFFQKQLHQTREDLAKAELALKATQEQTGLIKLDEQGKALIEAVAGLRGQIAAKEVELRSMRTFSTESNPHYVRSQQQLAALREELKKLERPNASSEGAILMASGSVPEAGLEYLRRYRDVKYHEAMHEFLARQFEVARIDESREAALVQVVDNAVVPDRKSGPRRGLIVIGTALVSTFLVILLSFAREAQRRAAADPMLGSKLESLRRYLSVRRRSK